MNDKKSESMALGFLKADSEAKVKALMSKIPEMNIAENWRPYGGKDKNWDRIGAQQTNPVGALTEKLTNSIDAVLMKLCMLSGLEPRDAKAPKSMLHAVESLIKDVEGIKVIEGRIAWLDDEQRRSLARKYIRVAITGSKKRPCYTIIDSGEGQHPDMFETTFVSLGEKNKQGIPFVQGRYNMGSTGSLRFCGEDYFQLIISRRYPEDKHIGNDGYWGWTLIRKRPPRADEEMPLIEYFCPNGKITRFKRETVEVPGVKGAFVSMDHGSVVKLYDYDIGSPHHNVDLGLNDALTTSLIQCAFPVRLADFRAKVPPAERTFSGMDTRLFRPDQDYMDQEVPFSIPLSIPDLGEITIEAIPLKKLPEFLDEKTNRKRVFFMVNGQVHSFETRVFIHRARLPWLKDRLVVTVNCDDLRPGLHYEIFMANREYMADSRPSRKLKNLVRESLATHDGLIEFNRRVNEEKSFRYAKEDKDVIKIFEALIKHDPGLRDILDLGVKLKTPIQETKREEFKGKEFPTFLKLTKGVSEGIPKEIPINLSRILTGETDVKDNYFTRAKNRGKLHKKPDALPVIATLNKGRVTFRLQAPVGSKVGDEHDAILGFEDVHNIFPITVTFKIKVTGPERPGKSKKGKKADKKKPESDGKKMEEKYALPTPREIYKSKEANPEADGVWNEFDPPFDEATGSIVEGGDGILNISVNMDNKYLVSELLNCRDTEEKPVIKKQFKWGIGIMTLAIYKRLECEEGERDTWSRKVSEALSPVVTTVIRRLNPAIESDPDV
jgi:hypothetical protein